MATDAAALDLIRHRLREALAEKKKTHRALAADINLSESSVSVWLTQDKGLRQWVRLRDVARALGVSADRLLGLAFEDPTPPGPGAAKGREWAYLPKVATAAAGNAIDYEHDEVDWFLPLHRRELGKVVIGTVVHVGQDTAPRQALPGKPPAPDRKTKADLAALVEARGGKVVR